MKTVKTPVITFQDIDLDFDRGLVKTDYFDHKGEYRTLYTDLADFEQWLRKYNKLQIDNEFRSNSEGGLSQATHQISMDELFFDVLNADIRDLLAKEFFSEILNIVHLEENLKSRALLVRLKNFGEEVLSISRELGSFRQSA